MRSGELGHPGHRGTTYVFVAVGASQVERRVAVVVLHLGAGFIVQEQQLPREESVQVRPVLPQAA